MEKQEIRLLLSAKDETGIEARVSNIVSEIGSITGGGEYLDDFANRFFLRKVIVPTVDYETAKALLKARLDLLRKNLQNSEYSLSFPRERRKKVAILVSKETHCLDSLLHHQTTGNLDMDIGCIISNHDNAKRKAEIHEIPFHRINPTKENRREQEIEELTNQVDLVILARYMQIVSQDFIDFYNGNVINVHHGLLPAFKGANPYKRAYLRGVTQIGATAHFATAEIDEGPIIYQSSRDVLAVKNLEDLKAKGSLAEQEALVEGVKMFLEDRLIRYKFTEKDESGNPKEFEKVAKFY